MFLVTLWSSIKEVEASFLLDEVHGMAMHAVQWNRASSRGEGEFSWFFLSCGGNVGYILMLRQRWHFKTCVCSAMSGLLSHCKGHLEILIKTWQGNRVTSRGEAGDPVSLSSCHSDIGIPINFQEQSGFVSF